MQLSLKLMLYCGIRPTEVTRIDPLRKVAPYLRRHRHALTGPDRREQRWRALRRAARFPRWQADACRHTFVTYHARHFRNLTALQLEMGHTTTSLLLTRYVSPIPQAVAKRFWHATFNTR